MRKQKLDHGEPGYPTVDHQNQREIAAQRGKPVAPGEFDPAETSDENWQRDQGVPPSREMMDEVVPRKGGMSTQGPAQASDKAPGRPGK